MSPLDGLLACAGIWRGAGESALLRGPLGGVVLVGWPHSPA